MPGWIISSWVAGLSDVPGISAIIRQSFGRQKPAIKLIKICQTPINLLLSSLVHSNPPQDKKVITTLRQIDRILRRPDQWLHIQGNISDLFLH